MENQRGHETGNEMEAGDIQGFIGSSYDIALFDLPRSRKLEDLSTTVPKKGIISCLCIFMLQLS